MIRRVNRTLFRRSGTRNMLPRLVSVLRIQYLPRRPEAGYPSKLALAQSLGGPPKGWGKTSPAASAVGKGVSPGRRSAVTEGQRQDLDAPPGPFDGGYRGLGEAMGGHGERPRQLAPAENLHQPV